MYDGTSKKLYAFLKGKIVTGVTPNTDDEGHFTLTLREHREDGNLGKMSQVRIYGTDMGWWFTTRNGTKGKWGETQ